MAHVRYLGASLAKKLMSDEGIRDAACEVAKQWVLAQHQNYDPNMHLVVPWELESFTNEILESYRYASRYDLNTSCHEYSNAELGKFISLTNRVSDYREEAERLIQKSASHKGIAGATTLSFQLSLIPITLEVIGGSLLLKLDLTKGAVKSTVASGIKSVSSSTGLEFLYLDIGNERRVYDTRGLDLNLDVVDRASLRLVKNKAIFTCISNCVKFGPSVEDRTRGVPSPKYQ